MLLYELWQSINIRGGGGVSVREREGSKGEQKEGTTREQGDER